MTSSEFARVVATTVIEPTVRGLQGLLEDPPGRQPSHGLLQASNWYRALDDEGRTAADWAIAEAARGAVFGLLVLLDGTAIPRAGHPRHQFEMWSLTDGQKELVNSEDAPLLHEAFAAEVPPTE